MGKSSAGWEFLFHTEEGFPRSWVEWKERLKTGEIRDEYGEVVTLEALERIVERKRGGRNHARECEGHDTFLDPEGHPFVAGEFS